MTGTQPYCLPELGAQRIVLRSGEPAVEEGHGGRHLYQLVSGALLVERGGAAVGELTDGAWFGELALLTAQPRAATVRALKDSELWVVPAASVTALLDSCHPLVGHLTRRLAKELREARLAATSGEVSA